MVEYEWEEMADMGVQELQSLIDMENHAVATEHKMLDALNAWEHIFPHIDERLSAEDPAHETLAEIQAVFASLRDVIEKGETRNISLRKEEQKILEKLKQDIAHKDWRAVKQDVGEEKGIEKVDIRAQTEEIKKIHSGLISMQKLLKQIAGKDEYISNIYKAVKTYEQVFRKLWEKERLFLKK